MTLKYYQQPNRVGLQMLQWFIMIWPINLVDSWCVQKDRGQTEVVGKTDGLLEKRLRLKKPTLEVGFPHFSPQLFSHSAHSIQNTMLSIAQKASRQVTGTITNRCTVWCLIMNLSLDRQTHDPSYSISRTTPAHRQVCSISGVGYWRRTVWSRSHWWRYAYRPELGHFHFTYWLFFCRSGRLCRCYQGSPNGP